VDTAEKPVPPAPANATTLSEADSIADESVSERTFTVVA
jgi:hypothetical protein